MTRAGVLAAAVCVAMLVEGAGAAQPLSIALQLDRCQKELPDASELAALLQVELPSIVSREVRISHSPESPFFDPAALRIDIQCFERGGNPLLLLGSQQPGVQVQSLVPLADVPPAERTRTMAMAIAEFLRTLPEQAPTPPIVTSSPQSAVAAVPIPKPAPRERLRRSTVALLSVSGVTLTAGVVLGSLVWSNLVHGSGGDIVGGIGYGALGAAGVSLALAGLTFGLNTR